jgi:hypothetical protein
MTSDVMKAQDRKNKRRITANRDISNCSTNVRQFWKEFRTREVVSEGQRAGNTEVSERCQPRESVFRTIVNCQLVPIDTLLPLTRKLMKGIV